MGAARGRAGLGWGFGLVRARVWLTQPLSCRVARALWPGSSSSFFENEEFYA